MFHTLDVHCTSSSKSGSKSELENLENLRIPKKRMIALKDNQSFSFDGQIMRPGDKSLADELSGSFWSTNRRAGG